MKIRDGFVSNSSSSSFTIYDLDTYELKIYKVSTGSETTNNPEDVELHDLISEVTGHHIGQNQEEDIMVEELPFWDGYKYKNYLKALIPLNFSFSDLIGLQEMQKEAIVKQEKKNED